MGQKVVRMGSSININCSVHGATTATFDTGSSSVTVSGTGIVRINDTTQATCGHFLKAKTGSSVVFADGIGVHRVGDTGDISAVRNGTPAGTYTVTSASTIADAA